MKDNRVSRPEFLKDTGLLLGGLALGAVALGNGCANSGSKTTSTSTTTISQIPGVIYSPDTLRANSIASWADPRSTNLASSFDRQ